MIQDNPADKLTKEEIDVIAEVIKSAPASGISAAGIKSLNFSKIPDLKNITAEYYLDKDVIEFHVFKKGPWKPSSKMLLERVLRRLYGPTVMIFVDFTPEVDSFYIKVSGFVMLETRDIVMAMQEADDLLG